MAIEVKNDILPTYVIVSCKQTKEKEDTCGGGGGGYMWWWLRCLCWLGEVVVKSRARAHA